MTYSEPYSENLNWATQNLHLEGWIQLVYAQIL